MDKHQKKAQVTVFIIVGMLLLILVVSFIHIANAVKRGKADPNAIDPAVAKNVKGSVEDCLREVSLQGINIVSIQGGRLQPQDPVDAMFADVSTITSLDKDVFASEISRYIKENIESCLAFSSMVGYEIDRTGPISAKVYINDDDVYVTLNMPLSVLFNEKHGTIDSFSATHALRTSHMIKTANQLLSDEQYNRNIMQDSKLDFRVFTFNDRQVVVIEDPISMLAGKPYDLAFAVQKS